MMLKREDSTRYKIESEKPEQEDQKIKKGSCSTCASDMGSYCAAGGWDGEGKCEMWAISLGIRNNPVK